MNGFEEVPNIAISQRSKLYSIPPAGVCTMYVQSLPNYLETLVNAHHLKWRTFVREVLIPCFADEDQYCLDRLSSSPSFVSVEGLCKVLGELTCRTDLEQMTMLHWRNVITWKDLHRKSRAWCPLCLLEQKQQKSYYEPLIWTLDAVMVCTIHKVNLVSHCPSCKGKVTFFHPNTAYGHCVHCSAYLGDNTTTTQAHSLDLYHSTLIGQMILDAHSTASVPAEYVVNQGVRLFLHETFNDNMMSFANAANLSKETLRIICNKNSLPNLLTFTKFNKIVPISKLLNSTQEDQVLSHIYELDTVKKNRIADKQKIQQLLFECLEQSPPIPLTEVSSRAGVSTRIMKWHFPELAKQIVKRFFEHRTGNSYITDGNKDQEIVRKLNDLLKDEQSPPLPYITIMRGLQCCPVWFAHHHPELAKKLRERHLLFKRKNHKYKSTVRDLTYDEIAKELEREIASNRVPPCNINKIAQMLGYPSSFITHRFPEQSKIISDQYDAYETKLKQEFANQLGRTILEMHDAGVYPSLKKVQAALGYHFQFRQEYSVIWREMLCSLGYD